MRLFTLLLMIISMTACGSQGTFSTKEGADKQEESKQEDIPGGHNCCVMPPPRYWAADREILAKQKVQAADPARVGEPISRNDVDYLLLEVPSGDSILYRRIDLKHHQFHVSDFMASPKNPSRQGADRSRALQADQLESIETLFASTVVLDKPTSDLEGTLYVVYVDGSFSVYKTSGSGPIISAENFQKIRESSDEREMVIAYD